jgi:hypothetical protein
MVSADNEVIGGLKSWGLECRKLEAQEARWIRGLRLLPCHAEVLQTSPRHECALLTANQPPTFDHRMQVHSDYLFTVFSFLFTD